LYDGKSVKNLLEKQGRQVINDWPSFAGGKPMIGYIPKKRQLIVTMSAGSGSVGDIYLFDMVTQSWVYGNTKVADSAKQTNFTTDWNGDLIYSEATGNIKVWNDTPDATTSTFVFKTKDIDFGDPSRRKKIYRVRISYKGNASAVLVYYSTDGDTDQNRQFEGVDSDGKPDGSADTSPLLDKSGDLTVWHHAELKPATSSQANNAYSFQFEMVNTIGADFEVNDISIIYRMKNIK